MREYGRTEVIREQCYYCGSRNKLLTYTKDAYTGEEVGMILRCCACGGLMFNIDPAKYDVMTHFINGKLLKSRDKCIRNAFCPHKQCPLYGTVPNKDKKPPIKIRNTDRSSNRLIDRNKRFVKDTDSRPIKKFEEGDY